MDEPGFPIVMMHPQHRDAVIRTIDSDPSSPDYGLPGAPERFPPIEVHSADQEAAVRARGYLRHGEAMPKVAEFSEYPKMMRHPQHVDAVPPSQGAQMVDGRLTTFPIPGVPEILPDVVVHNVVEQEEWEAKGYEAAGVEDPLAFERATVSPGKPGEEWPKWVDGVLEKDPDAPPDMTGQYPKWLHFDGGDSVLVQDEAAEARIRAIRGDKEPKPERQPDPPYVPLAKRDDEYEEFLAWRAARAAKEPLATVLIPPPPRISPEDEERATLITLAEETGVEIDKRWGLKRLREAVLGERAA
jgi:hypothetical protein